MRQAYFWPVTAYHNGMFYYLESESLHALPKRSPTPSVIKAVSSDIIAPILAANTCDKPVIATLPLKRSRPRGQRYDLSMPATLHAAENTTCW